ncbi:MAG: GntR family transcriptional regulator [Variovorax sp.]
MTLFDRIARSNERHYDAAMPNPTVFKISALEYANPHRIFSDVAEHLRRAIAQGELKPGDKLPPEREMAQSYGVSRNTMREALRVLGQSGLIEQRVGAKGGAFVRVGSSNAVKNGMRDLYFLGSVTPEDLTEARIAISAAVIRLACERLTEADLQELEGCVDAAETAHKIGDFHERTRNLQEFHVLLAKATRNPLMIATAEGIAEVTRQFVNTLGPAGMQRSTLASRRRLLQLLRERSAEEAVAEMTGFLRKLHNGYITLAKGTPPGQPVARAAAKRPASRAAAPARQPPRPSNPSKA